MKRVTIFSSLFLFVFGMTAGLTLTLSQNTFAGPECDWECLGENVCHLDETGPLCLSNPKTPYYLYFHPTCSGGPLNCTNTPYWIGCCARLNPI
jgi:hypothetical protein